MPPPVDDYYALLGVPATASDDELRRAWRQLALQLHPDRAGAGSTARFQQLSAAYAVLSDPLARLAYDRRRRAAAATTTSTSATPPPPRPTNPTASSPQRPARRPAPAVQLHRLSGPLTALLACGAARHDEPGFITLVLRDDEATQGGMATISMHVDVRCPDCAAAPAAACPRCADRRTLRELFSAWLAIPPGVTTGEVLAPSVDLPGTIHPVRFRVLRREPR
jgi:curved DNA-binding protein CbpA